MTINSCYGSELTDSCDIVCDFASFFIIVSSLAQNGPPQKGGTKQNKQNLQHCFKIFSRDWPELLRNAIAR